MYLYHLLITLNDYQVIQNPCSLNYTLADTVPFDLKQEEGTPYGWRRSVSLTETHSPPTHAESHFQSHSSALSPSEQTRSTGPRHTGRPAVNSFVPRRTLLFLCSGEAPPPPPPTHITRLWVALLGSLKFQKLSLWGLSPSTSALRIRCELLVATAPAPLACLMSDFLP